VKQTKTFGEKLKRLMQIYDMQQEDIASLCGLQQGTISMWINNKNENFYPKVEYLIILARHFNLNIDDLVNDKPLKAKNEAGNYTDSKNRPIWVETKEYEGFCLVDKSKRKFIGVNDYELSFGEAKFETIRCRQLAPAVMYKLHGKGRPLKLEALKNLYVQSVIEGRNKLVWVEAFDNGAIKNSWLNGWYQLRENSVNKGDINFLYVDYGSHWIAYKE